MTDYKNFIKFKKAIVSFESIERIDDFLIEDLGRQRIYYAPFDYVNTKAKICIVGLTPGKTQMENIIIEAQRLIKAGVSDQEVIRQCKHVGSFSGNLRKKLVDMLDFVGFNKKLGIDSCSRHFTDLTGLANFTSAAMYPVFSVEKGEEKNFNKSITGELYTFFSRLTAAELEKMPDAWIIPLGPKVHDYLEKVVSINGMQIRLLPPLPHPSGANQERIQYFLRQKQKSALSIKTNAAKIDAVRNSYFKALREFS